jgi:REP element-mobilizing transposase RayT
MGRKLRYIPDGGALVEVTCRTLHGRLLLRPSPELNDIAAGILGRAQRLYPVDIVTFQALSNHYHALLFVKDAKRLAEFAGYFNSNLAREVGRLTGWTGKIWERRYQAIPISGEEEAHVARLMYVLSHGV